MWNTTTARLRNRTGWTNKNYADAYDTRTNALRWAPQPWLRRLWNLRKYRRVTSNRTGRWIYAIYSVKSCKVYVGQTGDRGTLKSLVRRMRQHLTCARSWHTLYGSKGCTNLGSIYPAMATLGDEHWGIMTLEGCTPGAANKRERWWIRKSSPDPECARRPHIQPQMGIALPSQFGPQSARTRTPARHNTCTHDNAAMYCKPV